MSEEMFLDLNDTLNYCDTCLKQAVCIHLARLKAFMDQFVASDSNKSLTKLNDWGAQLAIHCKHYEGVTKND